MHYEYVSDIIIDYETGPNWWRQFIDNSQVATAIATDKQIEACLALLKEGHGTAVAATRDGLFDPFAQWVVMFEKEEDFVAFKLKWA
jgi:hypothetical protein